MNVQIKIHTLMENIVLIARKTLNITQILNNANHVEMVVYITVVH